MKKFDTSRIVANLCTVKQATKIVKEKHHLSIKIYAIPCKPFVVVCKTTSSFRYVPRSKADRTLIVSYYKLLAPTVPSYPKLINDKRRIIIKIR